MQPLRHLFGRRTRQSALAALLALWCLTTSVLGSSTLLHCWLHVDAAESSHQCAITLFEQQQITPAEGPLVLASQPLGILQDLTFVPSLLLSTAEDLLPPG